MPKKKMSNGIFFDNLLLKPTGLELITFKPSIMKKGISKLWLQLMSFILLSFSSVIAFAQDKGVDVDINVKKESAWYQNPIVWVIGGAVFILLLVALLRGGDRKSA